MAPVTETAEQEKERERREAILLLFLYLLQHTQDHLTRSVTAYLSGSISIHTLVTQYTSYLQGAHTMATHYGRQLAGVSVPLGDGDAQFAATIMQGQAPYITRLITQLGDGEFTLVDGALTDGMASRILQYVLRCRATALEAWSLGLPDDTLIERRLGDAVERHCEECPPMVGFYRADAMTQFPGDHSTVCGAFCDCRLLIDGVEVFPFPIGVHP